MINEWITTTVADACYIDYGTRVVRKRDGGSIYPVYGGGGATFKMDTYNRENCLVVARFAISERCTRFVNGKFFLNDSGLTLRPKDDVLTQEFLNWILISKNDEIYSYGKGSAQKNLDMEDFRNMIISYPKSKSEQQRIVDILDAEFAKIDALKENAEKNLQNAKDLFQAVLRKELEPKEGWRTVSIGDIAELKGGKRVPKGYKLEKTPTPYPYIRVADFNSNGSVDLDDIHYISEEVYNGIKRYIITTNDVYISIAGTIGKSGIVPNELNGANLTENACRLVFKEDISPKYIYYCTLNPDFKEQIAKLTMQAAQPKLALTRLATAVCNIPPRKEQDEIVDIISTVQNNITILCNNYIQTLTLCDDLKQALLRKAFNGDL